MTRKQYHRDWYLKNRKKKLLQSSAWASKNSERMKFLQRRWYIRNRKKHTKNCILSANRRAATQVEFRILRALRTRVWSALNGVYFSGRTLTLIGCSVAFLKSYLSRKLKPGMTWDNWGQSWHIDHKRPCASFDLTKESERLLCFHYTNLQPLTVQENKSKGSKWIK